MGKIDTNVGSLVSLIKSGELRLPEMQRKYVWTATRVRDLLDSLYREYPSGTILVWESENSLPTRDLAVEQEVSPFKGHKLLLDGQQRLTSLTAILHGEPVVVRGKRRPIEILFNLDHPEGPPVEVLEVTDDNPESPVPSEQDEHEEGEDASVIQHRLRQRVFVVAARNLTNDPRWVNVSDVFSGRKTDAEILSRLVDSFSDPKFVKYSQRLQKLRKIKDYPYVMHVLDKQMSYEEVAEIFVRVNSLGAKLRGSDLALAQITSRWRDSLQLFEAFQEECEEKWYSLDLGLIIRGLVVFSTGQSRFKTVGTIPLAKLKNGWEDAKEGIRFAINFMRTNVGIEDESLLASPAYILTVGYFAWRNGFKISADDEAGLRRWLLVANARGHYSGSSETYLDQDLSAIDKGAAAAAMLELLRQQHGRLTVEPADLEGRGERSALFSLAYLALKAKGAKDWRSRLGLALSHQGKAHYIQYHHIFPKATLKKVYESSEINEIANMAFISGGTNRRISSTPAQEYLGKIVEEQGEEALKAHCIPTNPVLWEVDKFRDFLQHRRIALAQEINDFIQREAEIGTPGLGLMALIEEGESESVEFKSSLRWDRNTNTVNKVLEQVVAKSIAGLANAKGGHLLIGVFDDGSIAGVEDDIQTFNTKPNRDGFHLHLMNLVKDFLSKETTTLVKASFHTADGKDVCHVEVSAALSPVYLKDGTTTRLYIRTGNSTQEFTGKDALEYAAKRWSRVF